MKCYQCGTCTADCTSANIDSKFNPRKIMLEYLEEGKFSEFCWLCASCFKCYRCPREVKPYEILSEMRSKLIEQGKIPAYVKAFVETVKDYGELDETAFFIKLAKSGMFMDTSVIISTLKKRGIKAINIPRKSECAKEISRIFLIVEGAEKVKSVDSVKKAVISGVPS